MYRNSVLEGLIGQGEAGEEIVGRRRLGDGNAVLVEMRNHGVILREGSEDEGRRAGRHIIKETGSYRAEEHGNGRNDERCDHVRYNKEGLQASKVLARRLREAGQRMPKEATYSIFSRSPHALDDSQMIESDGGEEHLGGVGVA